jgi:protein TonB
MMNNQLTAPTKIPHDIKIVAEKEAPPSSGFGVAGMEGLGGSGGGVIGSVFGSGGPKIKEATPKKVNISGGVAAGMLLQKTVPTYPPIAKAARVSGTVILQATISKTGTITNLKVVSGPAMLQGAATDAVRSWRYRPYLLNGEPVEVETTVNVVFTLGG